MADYYGNVQDLSSTQVLVYGYLSVLGANTFFGSFGVPIKTKSVTEANVDPLVYQTYKTLAVFLSSWLVLTYVEFYFTWWGFVGASMWVPNGCLAIISIRMIGLGTGQAIWSALTIVVSFIWGATVLHEEVTSWGTALIALALLILGIFGVAYVNDTKNRQTRKLKRQMQDEDDYDQFQVNTDVDADDLAIRMTDDHVLEDEEDLDSLSSKRKRHCYYPKGHTDDMPGILDIIESKLGDRGKTIIGLAAAIFIGVSNGSLMLPLSYAPPEAQGITYIISFGIGAVGVTALFLLVYYLLLLLFKRPLPSFQVKVAAIPALSTGLMWAIGNYCSIYATLFLGQTIGYPLVQCSLLVAGLWGIFYYKEITGVANITFFFMWTAVVLIGVFLLSLSG